MLTTLNSTFKTSHSILVNYLYFLLLKLCSIEKFFLGGGGNLYDYRFDLQEVTAEKVNGHKNS